MDPLSLGLAVASAGSGIFSSITGNNEKKSQIKAANKQIKAQNQFAMQNWQYNEQMRQRQERQNNALYEMRKKEFALQKELDLDAFKEFYEDNQLQFNNLVRQVRAKSFQSSMKLAATQNKAASSALARGATGSRVGARGGAAALLQSMEQASRNEQLAFAEQQADKADIRAARKTNLRIQQAFNRVGPAPQALPVAPMPVMGQMQQGPSGMGMFADILGAGISGISTYASLAAPSGTNDTGDTSGLTPRADIPSNELSSAGQVGWPGRGGMR